MGRRGKATVSTAKRGSSPRSWPRRLAASLVEVAGDLGHGLPGTGGGQGQGAEDLAGDGRLAKAGLVAGGVVQAAGGFCGAAGQGGRVVAGDVVPGSMACPEVIHGSRRPGARRTARPGQGRPGSGWSAGTPGRSWRRSATRPSGTRPPGWRGRGAGTGRQRRRRHPLDPRNRIKHPGRKAPGNRGTAGAKPGHCRGTAGAKPELIQLQTVLGCFHVAEIYITAHRLVTEKPS